MADISVDFSDDFSRFEQVIFQRGKVVLDGELNEIGRIGNVRTRRIDQASFDDYIPKGSAREFSPCFAKDVRVFHSESNNVTLGDNQILIGGHVGNKAMFKAYGYVFRLPEEGVVVDVDPNTGNDPSVQQVYFTVKEQEVTAAADPSIKVDDLDETAVRRRLIVTFKVSQLNQDASQDYDNALEPWEGGERPVLVATVHRAAGADGPLNGNEVRTMWRHPTEMKSFIDRFFSGSVRLHPAAKGGLLRARAYHDPVTGLRIENLSALLAFNLRSPGSGTSSAWTVRITGTFPLGSGEALVAIVPSSIADGEGVLPSQTEYVGVTGTPGPGQLELRVVDPRAIGWIQTSDSPKLLDNMFVIAYAPDRHRDQSALDYDIDIVFADGKRITRSAGSRNVTGLPADGELSWEHGNLWEDSIHPDGSGPSGLTNSPPRWRSILPPSDGKLNALTEIMCEPWDNLDSNIKQASFLAHRVYTARNFRLTQNGDNAVDFTGEIRTVNALWSESGDQWIAEIPDAASMISYFGVNSASAVSETITAYASRAKGTPVTWDRDEWVNISGVSARWHVLQSSAGSLFHEAGAASTAVIRDWYKISYAEGNQPLRFGGSTPAAPVRWEHVAATRVAAYGVVRVENGQVRLDDGAFNLANPTLTDEGTGNGNLAWVELDFTTSTPLGLSVQVHLMWNHDEPSGVPAEAIASRMQLYGNISSSRPDKLRIYGVHDGLVNDDKGRPLAIRRWQFCITAFGGWLAPGPVFP